MIQEELVFTQLDAILGASGLAVRDGFTYNPMQVEFARRCLLGLSSSQQDGKSAITPLQAETGTGKTIGYATALFLVAALTGERSAISTHTRALQRQLCDSEGDLSRVQRWVFEVTGKRVTFAPKLGRGNFISRSACCRMLDQLYDMPKSARREDLIDFIETALEWLDSPSSSGVMDDFLIEVGLSDAPSHCPRELLCLDSRSENDDFDKYDAFNKRCEDSQVMVCNHALLVINRMTWGGLFAHPDGFPMSLVVVDEADRLPDASQSFSEARLSLFRLQQITEKSIDILGIPLSLHAAVSALLADAEKAGRHDETQRKTSSIEGFDSNLIALRNHFKDVIDTMAPTWAGIGGNHALDSLLSDFFDAFQSLDMAADAVDARLEDPANLYVSWAPSHKYPTLSVVCADAGWRMGLLWRHHGQMEIRSVVFCSATLADPSERGIRGVSPFLRSVGVLLPSEHPEKSNPVNENLYATFSRPSFGALDFVLCDPRIPPPISEVCEDDVTFDKKWVKHATAMILKAASFGEGVLVLAKSYRDVEVFEPGLKSLGDRLLCHLRHRSFASLQQQFMDADNAVLFSPAAWEGIDMPGKIRHLVILRIPNSKPDEVRQSVRAEVMRKRGLPEHAIRAIFARESLLQTKRRLIQGMGRPIRSSSDRATVWICDPRFPLPESLKELIHPMNACKPPHRVQSLRDTIPSRFQHIFEQSRVYLKDGLIIDSEGDPV